MSQEQREDCGLMIKQLNDTLKRQANNRMRTVGVTLVQTTVLMELYRRGSRTASLKELERELHLSQSTIADVIMRMEQKRLLEGFEAPYDRRIKLVRLLPEGENRCREARADQQAAEDRLLAPLSEAEQLQLRDFLRRMLDSLQEG
ncbi:MAG: MarR family transcriptional regulator [Eubacteriales bacterium]|nr:MarR family transcriptional regulator [Eubacteriales bacterium]